MELDLKVKGVKLTVSWSEDHHASVSDISVYAEDSQVDIFDVLSKSAQDDIDEAIWAAQNSRHGDFEPDDEPLDE